MAYRNAACAMGSQAGSEYTTFVTDEGLVRALVEALRLASGADPG